MAIALHQNDEFCFVSFSTFQETLTPRTNYSEAIVTAPDNIPTDHLSRIICDAS